MKPGQEVSRRQLFSICGQLLGHYPVSNWLRVACGFIKRHSCGEKWDDDIGQIALKMLDETLVRVSKDDPVQGEWHVSERCMGTVWCDASSLALDLCLEIGGQIVEDAS